MAVTIAPLKPRIGAEIRGLDLSTPIPDEDFARVRQAFYDHDVIAIRGGAFHVTSVGDTTTAGLEATGDTTLDGNLEVLGGTTLDQAARRLAKLRV